MVQQQKLVISTPLSQSDHCDSREKQAGSDSCERPIRSSERNCNEEQYPSLPSRGRFFHHHLRRPRNRGHGCTAAATRDRTGPDTRRPRGGKPSLLSSNFFLELLWEGSTNTGVAKIKTRTTDVAMRGPRSESRRRRYAGHLPDDLARICSIRPTSALPRAPEASPVPHQNHACTHLNPPHDDRWRRYQS
jgi:hypothetical protein